MEQQQTDITKKKKRGRKPKFDYRSAEFLDRIEKLAQTGMTDMEIAHNIGLCYQKFSEKKNKIREISETLTQARLKINAAVRARFLKAAMGGDTVMSKSHKRIVLKDGTVTDDWLDEEITTEQPANTKALDLWLRLHDDEWRERSAQNIDITSQGKSLAPPKVAVEIIYNKKEDCDLQDKDSNVGLAKDN
ncbi:MAG: hypothetical protein LKK08_06280 [Bacteroidales bacterium]|jgi:hypothetical protein|nr:hypothetical protein [Bacteroidales bacterium]